MALVEEHGDIVGEEDREGVEQDGDVSELASLKGVGGTAKLAEGRKRGVDCDLTSGTR